MYVNEHECADFYESGWPKRRKFTYDVNFIFLVFFVLFAINILLLWVVFLLFPFLLYNFVCSVDSFFNFYPVLQDIRSSEQCQFIGNDRCHCVQHQNLHMQQFSVISLWCLFVFFCFDSFIFARPHSFLLPSSYKFFAFRFEITFMFYYRFLFVPFGHDLWGDAYASMYVFVCTYATFLYVLYSICFAFSLL